MHNIMESLNYVATGIQDVLPMQLDLSRDLALSSDITRRESVELYPPNRSNEGITSTNSGNTVEIKMSDSQRWVDTSTICLMFDVTNIQAPTAALAATNFYKYNVCQLDGPFACLQRMNVSIGGKTVSSPADLNKHMTARWLNKAMASHVIQDAQILNPGCAKLVPILQNPITLQAAKDVYETLSVAPSNFKIQNASFAKTDDILKDAHGCFTGNNPSTTLSAAFVNAGYGHSNAAYPDFGTQQVCIRLADVCPIFEQARFLPLFLLKDIIFSYYFAGPKTAFMTDLAQVTNASTDTVAAPDVFVSNIDLYSYDVVNIKMVADLLTVSDQLNNSYRMMAASSEGLMIPFFDVQVKTATVKFGASAEQMQAQLSTANLKSVLWYRQATGISQNQAAWSNSNFFYNGVSDLQLLCNNSNIPANPLHSPSDIILYNARSKGVIGNELANFVVANPYINHLMEAGLVAGAEASSLPIGFVAWMFYCNVERVINENPEILRNGENLKGASGQITVKWQDNTEAGGAGAAIQAALSVGTSGTYNAYALMEFQRVLEIKNSFIDILG